MVRIGGGSPGPPDVVSDDVSEGLGFFDRAIGEEASPDGLGASEVGGLWGGAVYPNELEQKDKYFVLKR